MIPLDLALGLGPVDVYDGHDAAATGKRQVALDVETTDRSGSDHGDVDHLSPILFVRLDNSIG